MRVRVRRRDRLAGVGSLVDRSLTWTLRCSTPRCSDRRTPTDADALTRPRVLNDASSKLSSAVNLSSS